MSDDLEGADIWGDAGDAGSGGDVPEKGDKPSGAASGGDGGGEESKQDEPAAADEDEDMIDDETAAMSTAELRQRIQLIDNEVRIFRSDIQRIQHESRGQREAIRENIEKVKLNKQLPYLVGNVVEVLEAEAEDGLEEEEADEGGATDVDAQRKTRSAVIRTSTRQTIYLPVPGLVDTDELKPSDLVGTNKDSYLILEKLPAEFDSRVKAMEVDERPTEEYSDIGGADKQIQELIEAIVLPMTHKDMFDTIGIKPPKGVLLHGPPGTGKTLLARACANQTNAVFLKLAGPQLVQMFIGDGAKLIRDAFELAKEKIADGTSCGAIIFIDELDAIGTKRFGGDQSGDPGRAADALARASRAAHGSRAVPHRPGWRAGLRALRRAASR